VKAPKNVCALLVALIINICPNTSFAQMSKSEFEITLKACADSKSIQMTAELLRRISALYSDESTKGAINDIGKFLSLLPEADRSPAYGIYQQCIVDILPRVQTQKPENPQTLPTVTYKLCSGEYQRACQPHDVYLYCYTDIRAWAAARCTSFTSSRYNTYGGNKCGYAMDLVTCTGPK